MRHELSATWALTWPLALQILGQTALGAVSLWAAGRLGVEATAAVGLGLSWRFVALVAGQGVATGTIRAVAVGLGGGQKEEAVAALLRGAALLVLVCVPLGLWQLVAGPALAAVDQPEAVRALATRQCTIGALGLPAAVGSYLLFLFLQLRGRAGVLLGIMGVGNLLNGVLAFGLTQGRLGLPAMGVDGVAWALVVAYGCIFGLAFIAALPDLRVSWPSRTPRLAELWTLAGQALPVGLHWGTEAAIWPATFLIVGVLGADALADHATLTNLLGVMMVVPVSLEAAGMMRVGVRVGAGQGWVEAARATLLLAGFVWVIVLWVGAVAPGPMLALYTMDPAAQARVLVLLPLLAAMLAAHGGQLVLSGLLRGLGDTRAPALLAGLGYGIVGLGAALLWSERFGLTGVWAGLFVGAAATSAVLAWRLRERINLSRISYPSTSTKLIRAP